MHNMLLMVAEDPQNLCQLITLFFVHYNDVCKQTVFLTGFNAHAPFADLIQTCKNFLKILETSKNIFKAMDKLPFNRNVLISP